MPGLVSVRQGVGEAGEQQGAGIESEAGAHLGDGDLVQSQNSRSRTSSGRRVRRLTGVGSA